MVIAQDCDSTGVHGEFSTVSQGKSNPTGCQYSSKVAMGDDHDVPRNCPFLIIFPMIRTNLFDDCVNPGLHLFSALAPSIAVFPGVPSWTACYNLRGQEALVVSVVPFSRLLRQDMVRNLRRVLKKDMERLVGPLSWRNENSA